MIQAVRELLPGRIQDRGVATITTTAEEGVTIASEILTHIISRKTLLLLSGGKTPTALYRALSTVDGIQPGAVGLVDERYGPKFHDASNEKMIKETGLLSYFEKANIPFHPILASESSREETALRYDDDLRSLFAHFPLSIGILGIGVDGHTAGLPAGITNYKFPISNGRVVTDFADFPGEQKERITMTFTGLTFLDLLIVLVFGNDKKKALEQMVMPGSREEIPARFFLEPDIRKKTLFITDQEI